MIMRIIAMLGLGVVFTLTVSAASVGALRVEPELAAHLEGVGPEELVPILVVMDRGVPQQELTALTEGLTRDERRVVVERELSRKAEASQRELIAYLEKRALEGRAEDIRPLWLINAVGARADRATVEGVSVIPGVVLVRWDKEVPLELLEDVAPGRQDEIVWGVAKIRAPEVWGEGYNGTGIVVCVCDSGVNYDHFDLRDHMWEHPEYPNHGRNFGGGDPNNTRDRSGHGTHVAGIVASDGTAGSHCGVAPNATVMIAKIAGQSTVFEAWQWAISMGADVITQSYSWKYPSSPWYAEHRQASEGILAAGVVHTNSTGNQGHLTGEGYPLPFNVAAPANCPPPWLNPNQTLREGVAGTLACGASDVNDERAYFSGRGPSSWDLSRHPNIAPYDDYHWQPEMGLLKPDVVAPGVDIKSCDWQDVAGYRFLTGTSMSTPHVAGAAALLLSYKEDLSPEAIQKALELTAVDLGSVKGKENDYGAGRIDVYAALQYLKNVTSIELKYFRAAAFEDRVRLSWDCESGTYAGFNVYRAVGGGAAAGGRRRLNGGLITGRTPFVFEDRNVSVGVSYDYWLEAIPPTGKARVFGPASATAGAKKAFVFALEPSYPNPATAEANIKFSLPAGVSGEYAVAVFDLAGRKVRTVAAGASTPGRHEVAWDLADDAGRKVAPGVYLYRLSASCGSAVRRLVVTR